ncbi:MAG: alpha/beta hydrolase [Spirochaetota bacterium]|nr:alpha/beta hydrolase [Spirochaetota bacterium]
MTIHSLDHLWIPAKKPTMRTLLVLHGRGDSYHGFLWLVEELASPHLNYLLVNAPDDYYGGYSWYDLPPMQLPGIMRSRRLMDSLFDELESQGIPSTEVLIFGFSQGCLMCLEWGARTHRKLAGFIGVSGYCYDPVALGNELSETAKQSSWLITHGTQDEVLAFSETEKHVRMLRESGLNLEFKSYYKGHTIDPDEELPLLKERIFSLLTV